MRVVYRRPCVRYFVSTIDNGERGSQVAERLGNLAGKQKVAGLTPGCAKLCCVLGQGTSPYLPRGNVPAIIVSRSG